MNITSTALDTYALTAHITLEAAELAQHLEDAKKRIAEAVTVEGFRKGKAPQHLVEQQISPQTIRAEALELALEKSFSDAIQQEKWDVMSTADLKVEQNDAKGLAYSVKVFLWPPVTVPDLTMVHVERKPIAVSDVEIDEALDSLRNMRSTFLDKIEPATTGDRVEVDFDATVDGKVFEGGSSRNHPLIIGGKSFMPGFEEQLIGLPVGEPKSFTLTAPADYYAPAVAGKEVTFSVTLRHIQSVLKPAADDAFAQSLGTFTSLAQLRDNVREGLLHEKKDKEHQRIRLAILDAMIAQTSVPAPERMVQSELHDMLHRFGHDLQGRGIELGMYLARMQKTEDDLRRDWKPEAERQVRIMLILRAVAQQQRIAVSPEDIDRAFTEAVGEGIRRGQLTEDQIDASKIRSALADRMLTDRTLEFLEHTCAVG